MGVLAVFFSQIDSMRTRPSPTPQNYLGYKEEKKKGPTRLADKQSKAFQFDWDASEDTSHDLNDLYKHRLQPSLLFGKGYQAGIDKREQRQHSRYADSLAALRQRSGDGGGAGDDSKAPEGGGAATRTVGDGAASAGARHAMEEDGDEELVRRSRGAPPGGAAASSRGGAAARPPGDSVAHARAAAAAAAADAAPEERAAGSHWSEKPLAAMTDRDWRIMKEDFDIMVRGGKAVNPLRKWDECPMPRELRQAIDEMGYVSPSPIQRQVRHDAGGRTTSGSVRGGAPVRPATAPRRAYVLPLSPCVLAGHPDGSGWARPHRRGRDGVRKDGGVPHPAADLHPQPAALRAGQGGRERPPGARDGTHARIGAAGACVAGAAGAASAH